MKATEKKQQVAAFLLAAGGVIFFSAKAVFVKMAYEHHIDTVSLILIRMAIAMPVYVFIVIFSLPRWRKAGKLTVKQTLLIVSMGILGYYFASYLDFAGLQYVSASMERLILFIYPTMVVGITAILYKKSIPLKHIYAIVITYFGIFLTFYQSIFVQQQSNLMLGVALIIACAFSYACFLVASGKLIPEVGAVRFTCYAMIVSGLAVLGHFLIKIPTDIFSYPTQVYWIGGGMAVFSTVLPSFMIAAAIKRIGAPKVAIIGSIGPVSTIIMAAFVLGERITAFQGLGALIVISGVLLITVNTNAGQEKSFKTTGFLRRSISRGKT